MTRVMIGTIEDFPQGELKAVKAGNVALVIAHTENGLCAVPNRCSHMPLPLAGGKLEGSTLTCPWHNSEFNVCTGENLDWVRGLAGVKLPNWSRRLIALGRKPQNLQTYPITQEDGQLFVEV
ncbi:MAG: Rieske (2Fe-2S) protein [Chloroflexota bacterium]